MDRTDHLIGRLRRHVYFLLGVAIIIDDVISPGSSFVSIIAGLILLGLIPVDILTTRCFTKEKPP